MPKKRSQAPPASPTDEWGIYNPAKAGMQALFSRLGRPILRSSAASERRERRRALRPERPADGVGLALQEAKRRAKLLVDAAAAPPTPPAPAPVAVAPEPPAPVARTARAKAARSTKRKTPPAIVAAEPTPAPTVAVAVKAPSSKAMNAPAPRRVGKPARPRPAPAPAVPPPSPRRPRGPVPLAAWAHAVHDTRRDEPKRGEAKGLWRGIFRIPSEVALMEYGRGCRIHRVVIETAADRLPESF